MIQAVMSGDVEEVKELLEQGANLNYMDEVRSPGEGKRCFTVP